MTMKGRLNNFVFTASMHSSNCKFFLIFSLSPITIYQYFKIATLFILVAILYAMSNTTDFYSLCEHNTGLHIYIFIIFYYFIILSCVQRNEFKIKCIDIVVLMMYRNIIKYCNILVHKKIVLVWWCW